MKHGGIAMAALDAVGGDPLLALALICDLLCSGVLVRGVGGSIVWSGRELAAAA